MTIPYYGIFVHFRNTIGGASNCFSNRRACRVGPQPLEMYFKNVANADDCMDVLASNLHEMPEFTERHVSLLGLDSQEGTLTLGKASVQDESALLKGVAQELLHTEEVDLVVMGHTHEPMDRPDGLAYYNPGCWTRNLKFS